MGKITIVESLNYHIEWIMMTSVPRNLFFGSEEKTFNFSGFNRYVSIEFSWWV